MQRCLHCLEPACVSACPTTALHRQPDGPVSYDGRQVHRLPLLHAGVSLGRADRGMEHARPEDLEVHALRRPRRSAGADRVQREAAVRRREQGGSPTRIAIPACVKACPADALRYGTREEMLALAHKRIADRPDKLRRPRLRREGAGRDERAVPVEPCRSRSSASRRTGRSPFRPSPRRRSAPFPRRDGRGRPARRRVRLLPEAGSGGGRRIGCGEAFRTTTATSNSSLSGTS
mgnify:CR=1 FL=1